METNNPELETAQDILDSFEQIHQLSGVVIPDSLDKIWNLPYNRLQKLSAVECAEYAFILAQYSMYVQKIYNREKSKVEWLENKIHELSFDKLNDYDQYTKYDVKLRLIAKENKPFNDLLKHLSYTKQIMTRLEFLPTSIKVLSDNLSNIQRAKSQVYRANNGHS
jgi:hypothetical protein